MLKLFFRLAELVPRWSRLRAIGNSGPAKLTILIPLVGYFVIFNAQLARYLELIGEIGGLPVHQLTVSPRLLLIYSGLCAFAVGSAIYSFFCPDEVKQYATSAAYVGGDGPNIKDMALEPMENELRASLYVHDYGSIRYRCDRSVGGDFLPQEAKAEAFNAILHPI
jgi:hypothetical protein